jgi:hypothetical protein
MADPEYTRLHITPLNPTLLTTILPPSILPSARNISYHTLQSFPEKSYGYVDLPVMDAEKIKKKLNGSILKGTKVRIEKARPQKEVVIEEPEPERKKKEKRKRKRDELPGVDIGERHVKRGWTTPGKEVKGKEKVVKSKYTTGPECLFKTVLPPNVAANAKDVKQDKKRKKAGKEAVVHEFAKTTKYATFLRSSGANKSKGVVEFVEGKGWVDESGNVVEIVTKTRKTLEKVEEPAEKEISEAESADEESSEEEADNMQIDSKAATAQADEDSDKDSEDSTSDDSASQSDESDHKGVASSISVSQVIEGQNEESSSDDSSSEEESDHIQVASSSKATKAASPTSSDVISEEDSSSGSSEDEPEEPQSAITSRPQSSSGPGLTIQIPDSITSTPIASSVHPLEAIYKRSRSDEQPKAGPSFSFFGDNENDEEIAVETHLQVPLTPFTQKDFEYRGIRSAAPTPDTAHPNKKFIWPTDNDDEDEEEEASSPIRQSEAKGKEKEAEPESDFQKWFWENRGNVNRAWKRRRKVVAKEKRQRENRKRQDRTI